MDEQNIETPRKSESPRPAPSSDAPQVERLPRAVQVIESTQTGLTALTLAFVFRAFLVEAFIIPTGSMAHSLLGAHLTQTCPACGWEYDCAPGRDTLCPNCHLRGEIPGEQVPLKAGDRILVHKWPCVLGGPVGLRRWDVLVFRNPSDPTENYIKRLIGLPGETVEIVDGDIYVDGRIARKTPAAQSALWLVVFDQDHPPHPQVHPGAQPCWRAEQPADGSSPGWSGLRTRVVRYEGLDDQSRAIRFEPDDRQYFQDVYAYNSGPSRNHAPLVGDLRMLAEFTPLAGDGECRWEITRDGVCFAATIRHDGAVSLEMGTEGRPGDRRVVKQGRLRPLRAGRPHVVEFAHLDYRVYLKVDGRDVVWTSDNDYHPDLETLRRFSRSEPVELRIVARALALELRGLRVDRDVYYTYRPEHTKRAYPGHLFVLGAGEYFVLGDNSPDSCDSREWVERGVHLPADYRLGTVREDQIVGTAAFVYLPGLLPLDGEGRWRLPDLGRVRFVR